MDTRMNRRSLLLGTGATATLAGLGLAAPAIAQNAPIRMGWLSTLEGPFATGGQDAWRCTQMIMEMNNNQAGGRRIEIIRESSNAQADVALEEDVVRSLLLLLGA